MFKMAAKPQFKREVKIDVPVDQGHEQQSVTALFNVLSVEDTSGFDLSTREGSTAFLERVVANIDGLVDDGGTPIIWGDRVQQQFFGLPYVRHGLTKSYLDAVGGARVGN
jgi:hypothetical protein